MNRKPYRDILDSAAGDSLSRNTDLLPKILARLERKTLMTTLRTRPAMAILVTLLILLALSGVVYALGRSFGFRPTLGIVETSSLRMLDKPVVLERDGFRVTVTEAAVDDSHTVIRYQVEWLTPPSQNGEYDSSCQGTPTLFAQDGTKVGEGVGAANGKGVIENGYWMRLEFPMLPVGLNDAKFIIPCLQPLVPGSLPQDWEFNLHFLPWDGTPFAPVYEIPTAMATETPVPITVTEQATLPVKDYGISFALDRVIELDTGYVFEGSANWTDPEIQYYSAKPYSAHLLDATGRVIPLEWAPPQAKPVSISQSRWAFQSAEKPSALPLTLVIDGYTFTLVTNATFDLDLGTAPQMGQTWTMNLDVPVESHILHFYSATWLNDPTYPVLQFQLSSDDNVFGAGLFDLQNTNGSGGGFGAMGEPEKGPFLASVFYQSDLPPGIIHISVNSLNIVVREPWQTTWQP